VSARLCGRAQVGEEADGMKGGAGAGRGERGEGAHVGRGLPGMVLVVSGEVWMRWCAWRGGERRRRRGAKRRPPTTSPPPWAPLAAPVSPCLAISSRRRASTAGLVHTARPRTGSGTPCRGRRVERRRKRSRSGSRRCGRPSHRSLRSAGRALQYGDRRREEVRVSSSSSVACGMRKKGPAGGARREKGDSSLSAAWTSLSVLAAVVCACCCLSPWWSRAGAEQRRACLARPPRRPALLLSHLHPPARAAQAAAHHACELAH